MIDLDWGAIHIRISRHTGDSALRNYLGCRGAVESNCELVSVLVHESVELRRAGTPGEIDAYVFAWFGYH